MGVRPRVPAFALRGLRRAGARLIPDRVRGLAELAIDGRYDRPSALQTQSGFGNILLVALKTPESP